MKQDVAVISLDAYAGQFYAQQVQELFGERITVCSYSVRDGSIEHMPRRYDPIWSPPTPSTPWEISTSTSPSTGR